MHPTPAPAAPLHEEATALLSALAGDAHPLGLRLNELAAATGLPVSHVGRHLRTLEAERLAGCGGTRWHLTLRGRRVATDLSAAKSLAA